MCDRAIEHIGELGEEVPDRPLDKPTSGDLPIVGVITDDWENSIQIGPDGKLFPPNWCFSGQMPRRALPIDLKKFVYPHFIYLARIGKPIMHPMWNSYFSGNFSPPKSRKPMKEAAEVQSHSRRCKKVYDLQGRKTKRRRRIPIGSVTAFTKKRMGSFDRVLAEATAEELDQDALEAVRLIQAEREWREAGCPPGLPYPDDEGEQQAHGGT